MHTFSKEVRNGFGGRRKAGSVGGCEKRDRFSGRAGYASSLHAAVDIPAPVYCRSAGSACADAVQAAKAGWFVQRFNLLEHRLHCSRGKCFGK